MLLTDNTIIIVEIYTVLIMAFIMANYLITNKGKEISRNLVAVFAFSILAAITDSLLYTGWLPSTGVAICVLVSYSSSCLAILFFNNYFYECVSSRVGLKSFGFVIPALLIALSVLLWVISLFTDLYYYIPSQGEIVYTKSHIISQLLPGIAMLIILINIISNIKKLGVRETVLWSSYIILPIIALPFQKYFSKTVVYIAMLFTIMIIYLNITVLRTLEERNQQLKSQALTLKLLYSQLKPHFVSNVMITIKRLIKVNPTLAYESISYFIEFFRDLIDLTSSEEMVIVDKEMNLVENYLYLQKLRFDDKLDYEINMETHDFYIPALSILPFVENAIDHGIRKKMAGGRVTINVFSEGKNNKITIKDDGIGVFESNSSDDNHTHIGIENTKEVLRNMCHGIVDINPIPGEGTTVTITIM